MDVFPAFKSNFGDWTYYVTTMKLKEVASKVMYADNLEYENTISDHRPILLSLPIKQ